MNWLRETDVPAFTRLCVYLAEWAELEARIRKNGFTYETNSRHGKMLRIHPDFQARDRIEGRLEALEDRFGLTPAMRQKLMVALALNPAAPSVPGELPLEGPGDAAPAEAPASPVNFLGGGSVH
jgi:P27 family predicted phage terminase small subunit